MSGRAATIALTRLMNHGLVLISPIILVRLLSVEEFGHYREFLLYVGLLITIAGFGINSSLLRFVPDSSQSGWRFVSQSIVMTFASSVIAIGLMLLINALTGGRLVGQYAWAVALYVFFFVNLDFWEPLYLAEKRSFAVLKYTTGRLVGRIAVVTITAALTRDVDAIITALICLEALRLAISAIGWRMRAGASDGGTTWKWREHLKYAVPFGSAMVVVTANRQLGALFVAKMLGPVALAHYAIGTYLQPIINVIRNSLSDVVLPEMVSKGASSRSNPLELWRRTAVVTAILLVAAGVLLARFADTIVVTLFSDAYRPAVPLFQLYTIVFLREALDFGIPLRAVDQTTSILRSNLVALSLNAALMLLLTASLGALGAVLAFVISSYVEGCYLAMRTARAYAVSLRDLMPWLELLVKVLIAAAAAALILAGSFWTDQFGFFGVFLGGGAYLVIFLLLLVLFRIPEMRGLLHTLRSRPFPASLVRK